MRRSIFPLALILFSLLFVSCEYEMNGVYYDSFEGPMGFLFFLCLGMAAFIYTITKDNS